MTVQYASEGVPLPNAGGRLGVLVLEVEVEVSGPIHLGQFPGASIRGAVGKVLRSATCLSGAPACTGPAGLCPLVRQCCYGYLWELSRHRSGESGWFPQPMAPYLFNAPWSPHGVRLKDGNRFSFEVKLLGAARAHAPAVALAIRDAFDGWVHEPTNRGRHRLLWISRHESDNRRVPITFGARVDDASARPTHWVTAPAVDPATDDHGWLRLRSPLWLRGEKKRFLSTFEPERFTADLVRRITHLSEFHEGAPIRFDWPQLRAQAEAVEVADASWVREFHTSRAKSGTDQEAPVQGLNGSVMLRSVAPELSSLWKQARWVHAGHESLLGLGHAVWEPALREGRAGKRRADVA